MICASERFSAVTYEKERYVTKLNDDFHASSIRRKMYFNRFVNKVPGEYSLELDELEVHALGFRFLQAKMNMLWNAEE